MTETKTLAGLIQDHAYTYPDSFCACGAHIADPWREWGAHVAAAVTAHLAAILADVETIEAVAEAMHSAVCTCGSSTSGSRDSARAAIAVIGARLGLA